MDGKQNGKGGSSGLVDIRRDLPKAVRSIFSGTAAQRKAAVQNLYAEVMFRFLRASHELPAHVSDLRSLCMGDMKRMCL